MTTGYSAAAEQDYSRTLGRGRPTNGEKSLRKRDVDISITAVRISKTKQKSLFDSQSLA